MARSSGGVYKSGKAAAPGSARHSQAVEVRLQRAINKQSKRIDRAVKVKLTIANDFGGEKYFGKARGRALEKADREVRRATRNIQRLQAFRQRRDSKGRFA